MTIQLSRVRLFVTGLVLAVAVVLSACGANSAQDSAKTLTIIADSVPHTDLLKQVEKLNLLGDVKLSIKEIASGVDANQIVEAGDADLNFFQHVPYLKDWNAQHKGDLVVVATTHIEPLGLYSRKIKKISDTPTGAKVAIPSDATNLGRALFVLEQAGLIKLNVKSNDPNLDISQVGQKNIIANPNKISFVLIDRPQLAGALDDPQIILGIVNGNYALEAGLTPTTDALAIEKAAHNPYANVIVAKPKLKDDPRVTKLAEALNSKQIKDYIAATYKGSVVPA